MNSPVPSSSPAEFWNYNQEKIFSRAVRIREKDGGIMKEFGTSSFDGFVGAYLSVRMLQMFGVYDVLPVDDPSKMLIGFLAFRVYDGDKEAGYHFTIPTSKVEKVVTGSMASGYMGLHLHATLVWDSLFG